MNTSSIHNKISAIFFLSGVSALIYQVCWQRLLFSAFGVDLESITIIVSAFMLGLGIGAFWGGRMADRFPDHIIYIFSASELAIGIFGFSSPLIISWTKLTFINAPESIIAATNFVTLLPATFLMGATLPLLTTHVNIYLKNIGSSIGSLYFINTLGASVGAISAGFFLFNFLTINQSIYLAATINCMAALMILLFFKKENYENK